VIVLWTTLFSLKRVYKKKAPKASPSKQENYSWLNQRKKYKLKRWQLSKLKVEKPTLICFDDFN
jgi:hypothetical protein